MYTLVEQLEEIPVSNDMMERFNQVVRAYFSAILYTYGYTITSISPFEHGGGIEQPYLVLTGHPATVQTHDPADIVWTEIAEFSQYNIRWQVAPGQVKEIGDNEWSTTLVVRAFRPEPS